MLKYDIFKSVNIIYGIHTIFNSVMRNSCLVVVRMIDRKL